MTQETELLTTAREEAVKVAVRKLTGELVRLREGTITNGEFRPTRTILGVYGQRQPEQYMLRVRLPYGNITAAQLRTLAEVVETYGNGSGHVTTRQDIQLHWLALDAIPSILDQLGKAGLITLQSGGNSVRNVTACPLAGICGKEAFDVTPYATAVDEYYVGNPVVLDLPRKFKSSFSGCPVDCALSAIQDFGAIAVQRSENGTTRKGFQVYVGGGLGSLPRQGILLEDFLSAEEVLPTYEAVIRLFARFGDRTRKDRARLKFVVSRLGEDEFRRLVREERNALKQEGLSFPAIKQSKQSVQPENIDSAEAEPQAVGYQQWLRWNVVPQRENRGYSVAIGLPMGDITSEQMETVAALAEHYPGSALRTSAQQNLYLHGLAQSNLPAVWEALRSIGLTALKVNGIADVTSCPGASACSLAITASKGLGHQLQQMLLEREYQGDEALGNLRVKISGCPDACGQHHLGDIGFYGAALHKDGRLYPAYVLYLGGGVDENGTRLGQPTLKLPARKVPQAVERLLSFYKAERQVNESFTLFVDRVGMKSMRDLLSDLTLIPPVDQEPSNFTDWDATRMYIMERGEGECSV